MGLSVAKSWKSEALLLLDNALWRASTFNARALDVFGVFGEESSSSDSWSELSWELLSLFLLLLLLVVVLLLLLLLSVLVAASGAVASGASCVSIIPRDRDEISLLLLPSDPAAGTILFLGMSRPVDHCHVDLNVMRSSCKLKIRL